MGLFRQRAVIRPPHVVSFHHPRSPQAKEDESYATVTEIARKALNLQLARTPQGRRLPTCPSVPLPPPPPADKNPKSKSVR